MLHNTEKKKKRFGNMLLAVLLCAACFFMLKTHVRSIYAAVDASVTDGAPDVAQEPELEQVSDADGGNANQSLEEPESAEPVIDISVSDSVTQSEDWQGGDHEPDIETGIQTEGVPVLKIEDTGRYSGMDRSYHDGYLPSVSGGRASIMLPLTAEGHISVDGITVTPQLGSTERSPFVYRNYQRTFFLTEEMPQDAYEPIELYLVRIDLELSAGRYNGIYQVILNVSGRSESGMPFSQSFTSYVTITDGKSTEPVTEEAVIPAETKPQSQPLLYISDYTVDPEVAVAGQTFLVTAVIRNTSKTRPVRNMAIRVSTDSTELTLLEDSSTVYWERLEADTTRSLQLRLRAENSIAVGKYNIMLDMTFDNEDAVTLSASGKVPVAVTQPMELQATFPDIASNVNAGDTVALSFQALNLGKSKAYNVRFELDGAGLIPNGVAYIGNLEAGSAGSAEMKVFVGSKDMNRTLEEGMERYGQTSGVLTMVYEDENGNELREEKHFGTFVEELVVNSPKKDEPERSGFQWWIAVVAGAAAVIAICGGLLYVRYRRRKYG